MLVILPIEKLNVRLTLNQSSDTLIDDLTAAFITRYGTETFEKADQIVIIEDKFFNIIKDKMGPQIIGEFLEETSFNDIIDKYLTLNPS